MRYIAPWARFKQGIAQDLQKVGHRLGPARARVQDSWRSLSVAYKLFFVVVGMGFLIMLARQRFPGDALSITALSQAPWHIGETGIGFVLIVLLSLLWRLPKRKAAHLNLRTKRAVRRRKRNPKNVGNDRWGYGRPLQPLVYVGKSPRDAG